MTSKRHLVLILGLVLLLGLTGILVFCGPPVYQQYIYPGLVRTRFRLTETAKPTSTQHTEIVTPTVIINHPKPNLTIDDKILEALNCPPLKEAEDIRYCFYKQPDEGPLASFKCFQVMTPNSLLGGMSPVYPMAECSVGEGKYVYQAGCHTALGVAYVIERESQYELIDSFAKLKATFAPIETENEALSYALAATGYFAYYGMEISSDYEYYVEQLEDTHVEMLEDRYLVHLYEYRLCGCGQHETYSVDVAVSRQGEISEIYREPVYRDVATKCID